MIERRVEGNIKLYSRSILIQEESKDLLPAHFRFVEGVVDSDELPLNVSRESMQRSPLTQRIAKTLASRLVRELDDMSTKEPEKYATFWREFGVFLKEGIANDPQNRNDIAKLLRFNTTKSGDEIVALETYKSRMIEGQEAIYYVLAEDLPSARRSPHLDALYARDIEALLLTDVLDGFMLTGLREYDGTPLRNVDDPNLTLPGTVDDEQTESISEDQITILTDSVKHILGDRITEARPSTVLRNNPVRLVSPSDIPGREMQRVQRMMDRDYTIPAKMLEFNPSHALVRDLAALADSDAHSDLLAAVVEQLYDSALLAEGLHPAPATMLPRIEKLMEAAARNARSS